MNRAAILLLTVLAVLLSGCQDQRPVVGTAQQEAAAAVADSAAQAARAEELHRRADEALVLARVAEREAATIKSQGKDATAAEIAAAKAQGMAEALADAAKAADARAEAARQHSLDVAKEAEKERQAQAEAARLAGVRAWCEWIGGCVGLLGLVAAGVLAYLGMPTMAKVAGIGAWAIGFAILGWGASLGLLEAIAPWLVLLVLLIGGGALVYFARHIHGLREAGSALAEHVGEVVAKLPVEHAKAVIDEITNSPPVVRLEKVAAEWRNKIAGG